MFEPPISLFHVEKDQNLAQRAVDVLETGMIASGPYIDEFERQINQMLGFGHAVCVNDMSAAIFLSLVISGIKPGDEVATTSFACMSTNAPIAMSGAMPLWIDANEKDGTMCPSDLLAKISSRTKAVILYHTAGYPADVRQIRKICDQHGMVLIEDCDAALFAVNREVAVGALADFSILSFYPNRTINATEGGALVCKKIGDAELAKQLRRYGIDNNRFRSVSGEINSEYDIENIGWSMALNNLCAAMGLTQLEKAYDKIQHARNIAEIYRGKFANNPFIRLSDSEHCLSSYWVYHLHVPDSKKLSKYLKKKGIKTVKIHYLTHRYSGFGTDKVYLKNSESFYSSVVALPTHSGISEKIADQISRLVLNFLELESS